MELSLEELRIIRIALRRYCDSMLFPEDKELHNITRELRDKFSAKVREQE